MPRDLLATPTIGTQGRVIGRPRKTAPENAAERIMQLAAQGKGIVGIAFALRTTREVIKRWMDEDPMLLEVFEAGREQERNELHQLVVRDARDGEKPNINAFFLLKTRHSYREGNEESARAYVTINLPAPMSRDDFLKTVSG